MCCCFLSAKLRLFAQSATKILPFIAKYFDKLTDCTLIPCFTYNLKGLFLLSLQIEIRVYKYLTKGLILFYCIDKMY